MPQASRTYPLPDSGGQGGDDETWIHGLTPTLSDASMFDEQGRILPLGSLAAIAAARRVRSSLRLLRNDPKAGSTGEAGEQ